ncbi:MULTISPECIES: alpha-ketoglutarate-dependent dioxygenase AlkB [unclassified Stenotrophomonas]|jgi:alkylated DNA repair dioxygenase AlkB|uniref:alpha-ketoglutarate-dependent dioxygenase AlkB family protein n=1 Tax=unclassified Stenotrophomonas TaxID=196198 RepID=UPI00089DD882|nr:MULTISPECIES: alpha-ketoglutarate-dependent dioxygenase AlkB [unclassified Stenotrophomonas]AOX62860.1 alpha-ketoglutarate-dependent dioxygenase AlkB [Stenotrophomonas sp. LM091]
MDLHLREAEVHWHRHWLPRDAADTLQRTLREDVPWEVHRIRMFGRQVDSPRLSCWMGDPAARYRYSGTEFVPQPWHPALLPLRDQLAAFCGHAFNSVLLNRYRDGDDGMGWHSDNEPELGPAPVIASLSLGAGRRFLLRRRDDHAKKAEVLLDHGDLLVMGGQTQRLYQHSLPKSARPLAERLNLTFRWINASGQG